MAQERVEDRMAKISWFPDNFMVAGAVISTVDGSGFDRESLAILLACWTGRVEILIWGWKISPFASGSGEWRTGDCVWMWTLVLQRSCFFIKLQIHISFQRRARPFHSGYAYVFMDFEIWLHLRSCSVVHIHSPNCLVSLLHGLLCKVIDA